MSTTADLYGFTKLPPWQISASNMTKKADYSFVWIYISPFILLIGSIGNILSLCVMSRRAFRHSTTRIYLRAMAVGDTCALFWRIAPEFLRASKSFDFSSMNDWTCRVEHFSFYTSSDAAIWFMASFTLDRLVAVCFPLHKKRICKKKTARLVVISVLSTAIFKNIHVFWTRGLNAPVDDNHSSTINSSSPITTPTFPENTTSNDIKMSCKRLISYSFYEENVRPWLAFTFVSLLPTIIIIISNFFIVRTLLQVYKFRQMAIKNYGREREMSLSSCHQSPAQKNLVVHFCETQEKTFHDQSDKRKFSSISTNQLSSSTRNDNKFAFTHASLMCISVSIMFLVCVAPSIILTIGRKTWEQFKHYDLAKAANNQLACLNHAGNFFLYCLTGERFRCELLYMLRIRGVPRNEDVRYRLNTSPSIRTMELLATKKST